MYIVNNGHKKLNLLNMGYKNHTCIDIGGPSIFRLVLINIVNIKLNTLYLNKYYISHKKSTKKLLTKLNPELIHYTDNVSTIEWILQ